MRSAADVAARLGAYVEPGFLEPTTCNELCLEIGSAPSEPAPLYYASRAGSRTERSHNSRIVGISDQRRAQLVDRLMDRLPRVQRRLGVDASRCTPPSFLSYGEGDFVAPHPDTKPEAADAEVRDRKITLVTFLNRQVAGQPGEMEYAGGSLILYGLMGRGTERFGIPIAGEPGMLVAFIASTLHEVQPVTSGQRHTVVSWFL